MNHHLLSWALSTPWALMPERMNAYAAVLARRYARKAGVEIDAETLAAAPIAASQSRSGGGRAGSIAVIPVYGTIVQRASQLGLCEGGTGTQDISQALAQALSDDTVGSILLDIDSPGGSVYGVSELGDEIRAARAQKPIVAIANSLAASAAYWIGCQASEFYMTPGGEVGSIGVWMAHQDVSKALADEGVSVTLISSGQFKTEGNPFEPLPDDARAFLQSRTDDYYAAFTNAVAKGRNVPIAQVRDGMGQGRVLGADDAMAQNMVDGVMPFSDVVRKMQRDAKGARSASARATVDVGAVEAAAIEGVSAEASAEQLARLSSGRRREIEILSL